MEGRALVDRSGELATLDRALAAARLGDPQVAVVRGQPGIGKSALLGAFSGRPPAGT